MACASAAVVLTGSALADGQTPRAAGFASLERAVVGRAWRRKAGDGQADIDVTFDATHRLTGDLSVADHARRTLDMVAVDWTWAIRDDRIDIGLPDANDKLVHVDCRIARRAPLVFVLSDCHGPAAIDLSGTWLGERRRGDPR